MKKKIFSLILAVALLAALAVNVSAEATPDINLTYTTQSEGKYTVTVTLANIPQNNGVEYAQILLTCRSSQHNIVNKSMTLLAQGNIQTTKQFNTSADSLLVLIEPKDNHFAGISNTAVYTFTVTQSGTEQVAPGFDLSAILILKDGTEQEINSRVTAQYVSDPTPPTTEPPTEPPTEPVTPPTTEPATQPSQPGNTTQANMASTQLVLWVMIALIVVEVVACVIIVIAKKKKKD